MAETVAHLQPIALLIRLCTGSSASPSSGERMPHHADDPQALGLEASDGGSSEDLPEAKCWSRNGSGISSPLT